MYNVADLSRCTSGMSSLDDQLRCPLGIATLIAQLCTLSINGHSPQPVCLVAFNPQQARRTIMQPQVGPSDAYSYQGRGVKRLSSILLRL